MPANTITPRASTLRVELPPPFDEVVLQPPGLGQLSAAMRLDPRKGDAPESRRALVQRLARQARLLLGPDHAHLVDELPHEIMGEIVHGLYLVASGIDPAEALAVQEHLRQLREIEQREAAAMAEDIDKLTVELAADLRITPAEAAKIPLADALSLRAKRAENARAEEKFEAAVHGFKL